MFSKLYDCVNEHGRHNKNLFSNQFGISFPIMSCYLLKMTKILYSGLESSTRVSSALLDVAALILRTVFYLLKQVALAFVGTLCRMITAHTTVSVV